MLREHLSHTDVCAVSGEQSQPPLADSVDQSYTATLKLLDLPEVEAATALRRCQEALPGTGDQRMDLKPELIHQSGLDEARGGSSTPNEIDVLAGLLLERGNFFESPDEARPGPECRSQGAREHVMRGPRRETGVFDFIRRRRLPSERMGLVRL